MSAEQWNHNLHYHPLLLAAVPAGATTALDVGCGEGLLTRELAQHVDRVEGIDLHEPSIARARATSPPSITYTVGDVLTHPYRPGSFDVVTAVAMLHHVDAREGLARLKSLVAPGGVLAVLGLAGSRFPRDLGWQLTAAGWNRILLLRHTYWEHSAPMVWPPPETYGSMRAIASDVLPGSRLRRLVLWRYVLSWQRPVE